MRHIYKVYAAVVLCCLALLSGCSAEPFSLARQLNLQAPSIADIGYSLVSAADNRIVADVALTLHNPNNLSIGLSRLQAEAFVNEVKVADIAQAGTATLTAQGNSVLNLRVTAYTDHLGTVLAGHISRGEASGLLLKGTAFIGFGWFSLPYPFTYARGLKTDLLNYKKLEGEKPLPIAGLAVSGLSSRWGAVGPDSLQVIHNVRVTNRAKDTATLSTTGYEVRGNGISLAEGTVGNGGESIKPGENTVVVAHTIKTQNIAPWLASHLNGGEVTYFEMSFKPGSSVETAKDKQPLDGRTFKADIQTNMASELMKLVNN